MDYQVGQEFRPNAGDEFMELSALPVDKHRQTQLWQQSQYLTDSGINSGLTTHTPSIVSSAATHLDAGASAMDYHPSGGWNGSSQSGNFESISIPNDPLMSPAPPSTGSTNYGGGLGLEPFNDAASLSSMPLSGINSDMKGAQFGEIDANEVASAIPDLIKVLRENDDQTVLYQATMMVYQLSKSEAIEALIGSEEIITEVVLSFNRTDDLDMTRFLAGTLYNISQTQKGLKAIFSCKAIPCLIRLLESSVEAVLFYAITTLHNLLLHQEGAKSVVHQEGAPCIRKMCALLRKNNTKFLTICTDCLQILAFSHPESKLAILQCGGPSELVRIMCQYSYEKLLWTTARVLKVLSVCSANKPAIIQAGGLDALGRHLAAYVQAICNGHVSSLSTNTGGISNRLVMNCLWTLRNLSDAAATATNPASRNPAVTSPGMHQLLASLVQLLTIGDYAMIACVAGILSNLTCNNFANKFLVCQLDGIKHLLSAMNANLPREDILEPCACALRHLTARHDGEEAARAMIVQRDQLNAMPLLVRVLHAATAGVCPDLSLESVTQQNSAAAAAAGTSQLQSWMLVKAMVGLIRNLAMNRENPQAMGEHNTVVNLLWLLYGTLVMIHTRKRQQQAPATSPTLVQNVRLEEIVEGICGALHILMRDQASRYQLATFQFPELRWSAICESAIGVETMITSGVSNYALALITYLLQVDQQESIQKAAAGVLCEVSRERVALEVIAYMAPRACLQQRLNELARSRNEAIATYCSTVLIRLTEEISGGSMIMSMRQHQQTAQSSSVTQASGPVVDEPTSSLLDTPPHPGPSCAFEPTGVTSFPIRSNSPTGASEPFMPNAGLGEAYYSSGQYAQGGDEGYYWRPPTGSQSAPNDSYFN